MYGKAAVYGKLDACNMSRASEGSHYATRPEALFLAMDLNEDQLILGGFATRLKAIRTVPDGKAVGFRQTARQIIVEPRPASARDTIANVTVLELEFEETPVHHHCSAYPQLHTERPG